VTTRSRRFLSVAGAALAIGAFTSEYAAHWIVVAFNWASSSRIAALAGAANAFTLIP